jgi:hypothetical protein
LATIPAWQKASNAIKEALNVAEPAYADLLGAPSEPNLRGKGQNWGVVIAFAASPTRVVRYL